MFYFLLAVIVWLFATNKYQDYVNLILPEKNEFKFR